MPLGLSLKLVLVYLTLFVRKDSGEPLRARSIGYIKDNRNLTEELKNVDDTYPSSQHHLVPITEIDYLERSAANALSMNSSAVSNQDGSSFSEHTTSTDISPDGNDKKRRLGPNDSGHSEGLSYLNQDQYERHVTGGTPLSYDQIISLRSVNQREQTSSERDTTQRGEYTSSDKPVHYIRVKANYAAMDYHPFVPTKASGQAPIQDMRRLGQLGSFAKYLSTSDSITRKGLFSYQHFSSAGSDGSTSQKTLELIQRKPNTATRERFYTSPTSQPAWRYLDMSKSKSYKANLFDSHPVALSRANYTSRLHLQKPAVSETQRKGAVQWLVLKPCSTFRGANETVPCRAHHHQPSATKESVSRSTQRKIPSQFQVPQITELRPMNPGIVPNTIHVTRGSMHNVPPSEIQPFQVSPIIHPQTFPTSVSYQTSKSVHLKNIGDSRQWQPQALPTTVSTQNTEVPSIGGPVVHAYGSDGSTVRDYLSITSGQVSKTSIIDARKTPRQDLSTDQTLELWSPGSQSGSIQNHHISRVSSVFAGNAASHNSKPVQNQTSSASISPERVLTSKGAYVSDSDIYFTRESTKNETHSHVFIPQKATEDKDSISSSHSNPATLTSLATQSGIRQVQAKIFNIPKEVHLDSNQSQANHGNNELVDTKYTFQKYSSHVKASQRPTSSVVVIKLIKTYSKDNRTESETQNGSENRPATYIQPQEPTDGLPIIRRKSKSKVFASVTVEQNNAMPESQRRLNQSTEAQTENSVVQVEVDPSYANFGRTNDGKPVQNEAAAQSLSSSPRQLLLKSFKSVHSSDVLCSTSFSTYKTGQAEPVLTETGQHGNFCSVSDSTLVQTTTGLVTSAAAAREDDVQPTNTSDTETTHPTGENPMEPQTDNLHSFL